MYNKTLHKERNILTKYGHDERNQIRARLLNYKGRIQTKLKIATCNSEH